MAKKVFALHTSRKQFSLFTPIIWKSFPFTHPFGVCIRKKAKWKWSTHATATRRRTTTLSVAWPGGSVGDKGKRANHKRWPWPLVYLSRSWPQSSHPTTTATTVLTVQLPVGFAARKKRDPLLFQTQKNLRMGIWKIVPQQQEEEEEEQRFPLPDLSALRREKKESGVGEKAGAPSSLHGEEKKAGDGGLFMEIRRREGNFWFHRRRRTGEGGEQKKERAGFPPSSILLQEMEFCRFRQYCPRIDFFYFPFFLSRVLKSSADGCKIQKISIASSARKLADIFLKISQILLERTLLLMRHCFIFKFIHIPTKLFQFIETPLEM